MPQYVAIIYAARRRLDPAGRTPTRWPSTARSARAAAAIIRGGAALYPTATATTVRVSGGKGGDVVTTDGPYAETKEVLTGFFLLECADLDEAIAAAAKHPGGLERCRRGPSRHPDHVTMTPDVAG